MATLADATEGYIKVCRKQGCAAHPFVTKMLDFLAWRRKRASDLHLHLAGNNYLMTKLRIEDADLLPLCSMLNNAPVVTSVDLKYNQISDHGAILLAQMLERNTTLKHISLMCNDIGPVGGVAIAKSLLTNSTLKSLKITGNKIDKKGGMALAESLQINSTLEALDCGDCDLEVDSLIALATVLLANTSVKSLCVDRPLIRSVQEEPLVHYGEMLRVNMTLEDLSMEKSEIRDFGTARLCEALCGNSKLKSLNIRNNRITRDGATEICKALSLNYCLKYLDLGMNRLECPGAIRLANCLKHYNNTLQCLVVSFNNIKSDGLFALAMMMHENTTLQEIYVWGNHFNDKSARAFAELLETGRITPQQTDIRPYEVDNVYLVAELNNRPLRHRFWMSYYGDDVPEDNEGFADWVRINGSPLTTTERENLEA